MIQTINPYSTARTAEIMSRYRPIAPKPEISTINSNMAETENGNENSGMPQSIRKSPYLRNVWAHLQARPTRTRKRGRSAAFPPPSVKRTRSCLQGLSPPFPVTNSPSKNLSMHGFAHTANGFSLVPLKCGLDTAVTTLAESVALPLLRYTAAAQIPFIVIEGKDQYSYNSKVIDLNAEADEGGSTPKEFDFMAQLKVPVKPSVITPQPVRPVGSSIMVLINTSSDILMRREGELTTVLTPHRWAAAEEVEKAMEEETVPAIISDSNHKVRLTNSAYKEMVGQPECCWLDRVSGSASGSGSGSGCGGNHGGSLINRIGGEVLLQFGDSNLQVSMLHGFTSQVKIEWESKGTKRCVNGVANVVRLDCEAKNYQFLWRFHTTAEASNI